MRYDSASLWDLTKSGAEGLNPEQVESKRQSNRGSWGMDRVTQHMTDSLLLTTQDPASGPSH